MSIKADAFSLCPFRSPVVPPRPLAGVGSGGNEPKDIFGPCLYAGCGIFVPTQVDQGKVLDGMCGFRATAIGLDVMNRNVASLVKLVGNLSGLEPKIITSAS